MGRRASAPTLAPNRLVPLAEVAARLGVSKVFFRRHLQRRFTDGRPADLRTSGVPVVIPADEVDLAADGLWDVLADFRIRLGRR